MKDIPQKSPSRWNRRFCIAPMMEWTDRHCRFFHRLLTRRALIYTEMLTTAAILRGDRARLLGFDAFEHPVALQLGGSDPGALAQCARIGQDFGYDEINLNVGCPSDRVQEGRFGACLMAEAVLVACGVAAMKAAVKITVTVKCRLGVDGVMMGRAAYQEPWRLLEVDPLLFGEAEAFASPKAAALALEPYIERELAKGVRLHGITRHVLGLFRSVPGARAFRRHLATQAVKSGAGASVMADALAQVVDSNADLAHIAAA